MRTLLQGIREEGDGERQDRTALLKRLFTPGTKQHVISALGEDTHKRRGRRGRERVGPEQRKETSRKLSRSAPATGV